MVRNIKIILVMLLVVLSASYTHASFLVELQTKIADLLSKVYNLQAQLNQIKQNKSQEKQTDEKQTKKYYPSDLSCLILDRDLDYGDKGYDVVMLQMFLARDSYIYPEAEISGEFDLATQRAVKRYQIKHSIVSWGEPHTTGFGRVGPKTRAKMAEGCEKLNEPTPTTTSTTTSTSTIDDLSKDILTSFEVKPVVGGSPLNMIAKFTLKSECNPYQLDWGDGTEPILYIPDILECDKNKEKSVILNHIYSKRGIYTVSLKSGSPDDVHGNKTALYLKTVAYQSVPVAMSSTPFTLDKTKGAAPLSVIARFTLTHPSCSSYSIDWGDGSEPFEYNTGTTTVAFTDVFGNPITVNSNACSYNPTVYTARHVYKNPGLYELVFRAGQGPLLTTPVLEKWFVQVNSLAKGERVADVYPTSGRVPLTVTVALSSNDNPCVSYEIDWGDGSNIISNEYVMQDLSEFNEDDFVFVNTQNNDDNDPYAQCTEPFYQEFKHTYVAPGTYQLKIKFGKGPLSEIKQTIQYITVAPMQIY